MYTKITWSILNPYIFSDIKESSRGWAMNLGDKSQNFLIFIAPLITGDEGWATNSSNSGQWSSLPWWKPSLKHFVVDFLYFTIANITYYMHMYCTRILYIFSW